MTYVITFDKCSLFYLFAESFMRYNTLPAHSKARCICRLHPKARDAFRARQAARCQTRRFYRRRRSLKACEKYKSPFYLNKGIETAVYLVFRNGIECRRGLVQNNDGSVLIQCLARASFCASPPDISTPVSSKSL